MERSMSTRALGPLTSCITLILITYSYQISLVSRWNPTGLCNEGVINMTGPSVWRWVVQFSVFVLVTRLVWQTKVTYMESKQKQNKEEGQKNCCHRLLDHWRAHWKCIRECCVFIAALDLTVAFWVTFGVRLALFWYFLWLWRQINDWKNL